MYVYKLFLNELRTLSYHILVFLPSYYISMEHMLMLVLFTSSYILVFSSHFIFMEQKNCQSSFRKHLWNASDHNLLWGFLPMSQIKYNEVPKTIEDNHIDNSMDNGLLYIFYTNADSLKK